MLIESPDLTDPLLADFTQLTDVALRKKLETERGLYLAEGEKVIRRAIAAGHKPRAFLLAKRWLKSLSDLIDPAVPTYVFPDEEITRLTGYRVHRGALASMNRPPLAEVTNFLKQRPTMKRIFVLEDLVDHTNVGAIFRSAAALGVDAVLVSDQCADPLYRRSIKVSMGTVFQVPWTRMTHWPNSIQLLHDQGWITASLSLTPEAIALDAFSQLPEVQTGKVALILGTEGDGLRDATISQAIHTVTIPMAGGVDSLNVAAASAVAAWQLR